MPIRMAEHEELLGADYLEHDIRHSSEEVDRAVTLLKPHYPAHVIDASLEVVNGLDKGYWTTVFVNGVNVYLYGTVFLIPNCYFAGHMEVLSKYGQGEAGKQAKYAEANDVQVSTICE